jgi:hypothetical protein
MQYKYTSGPNAKYEFVNDSSLLAFETTGVMEILQKKQIIQWLIL